MVELVRLTGSRTTIRIEGALIEFRFRGFKQPKELLRSDKNGHVYSRFYIHETRCHITDSLRESVGVALCSESDVYQKMEGMTQAFERAIAGMGYTKGQRTALFKEFWDVFPQPRAPRGKGE